VELSVKQARVAGWAEVGGREATLVQRCAAGDEVACADLVSEHQRMVVQLAVNLLGDRDEALDLSQEVFLRVFRTIHRFRGQSTLRTWIYRIAVNECYAWLRKKRVPLVYSGDLSAPEMRLAADTRPGADRDLAARDLAQKLLARLPEQDRTLLLLREVDGLPLAELAAMAGLPENTIKVRLYRARKKLVALAARLSHRPGGPSE
jgi:RNA polymerase sigma-70 factor (ECF subfamily)